MFHPDRRLLSSGGVSVLAHAGVLTAALLGALRPQRVAEAMHAPLIISWPQAPGHKGTTIDPAPGPVPPIDVPRQPPIGIPPIERAPHFDSRPLLGADHDALRTGGDRDGSEAWSVSAVEEPPVLLAGPPPVYPEVLRNAGVGGHVVVQAVIDTFGRAEPGSVVVESAVAGLEVPARAYALGALFRPGRMNGRAVRVLVRLPIDFMLAPGR